ncbi:MAG: hypothetical protein ACI8Q1_001016 [Parvicella sp.]|jgi:hypothetical protein
MKKVLTMMAVAAFFAMSATACGAEEAAADESKDDAKKDAPTEEPAH